MGRLTCPPGYNVSRNGQGCEPNGPYRRTSAKAMYERNQPQQQRNVGGTRGRNQVNNNNGRQTLGRLAKQYRGRYVAPGMSLGLGGMGGGHSVMTWKLDCGDAGTVDGISDSDAPGHWVDGGAQSYGDIDCTTVYY